MVATCTYKINILKLLITPPQRTRLGVLYYSHNKQRFFMQNHTGFNMLTAISFLREV